MTFVPPDYNAKAFTCPHCGAFARQPKWGYPLNAPFQGHYPEVQIEHASLKVGKCENCDENCLWVGTGLVYPVKGDAPNANADMPEDVKADYNEASAIYAKSPRGAAALLRLAIQKLMIHLGLPGDNINADIKALVAKGLPIQIQQALDVVRVTGNNAVHPGQLDTNDIQVAQQLFPLVNVIVEYQISLPAQVQRMYDSLPAGALAAIEKRDAAV